MTERGYGRYKELKEQRERAIEAAEKGAFNRRVGYATLVIIFLSGFLLGLIFARCTT